MSCAMDEGRKRVLAIVAGILVARHLKTTDDLLDSKGSPRTESMVAAAVQWAESPRLHIKAPSLPPRESTWGRFSSAYPSAAGRNVRPEAISRKWHR